MFTVGNFLQLQGAPFCQPEQLSCIIVQYTFHPLCVPYSCYVPYHTCNKVYVQVLQIPFLLACIANRKSFISSCNQCTVINDRQWYVYIYAVKFLTDSITITVLIQLIQIYYNTNTKKAIFLIRIQFIQDLNAEKLDSSDHLTLAVIQTSSQKVSSCNAYKLEIF